MDAWQRLAEALEARAAASRRSLRPAADDGSLEAAQSALGFRFHPEVRRGLELHDGAADFDDLGTFVAAAYFLPGNYRPLSVAEIRSYHQMLTVLLREMVAADPAYLGWWWHPRWLPVARDNSDTCLVVSHAEGADFGKVAHFDPAGHVAWAGAPQLATFLEQTAAAVTQGGAVAHWHPEVTEGALSWSVTNP